MSHQKRQQHKAKNAVSSSSSLHPFAVNNQQRRPKKTRPPPPSQEQMARQRQLDQMTIRRVEPAQLQTVQAQAQLLAVLSQVQNQLHQQEAQEIEQQMEQRRRNLADLNRQLEAVDPSSSSSLYTPSSSFTGAAAMDEDAPTPTPQQTVLSTLATMDTRSLLSKILALQQAKSV